MSEFGSGNPEGMERPAGKLGGLVMSALALGALAFAGGAMAQQAPVAGKVAKAVELPVIFAPAQAPEKAQALAAEEDEEEEEDEDLVDQPPSSDEQGQTRLEDSFTPTRRELIRDQRRAAFEATKFDVHLRSFYLDRDKYDDSESEAWAVGGWAGFKTGYFRNRIAFGATGYGSAKMHGPEDKDGTLLLKSGQTSYNVLGELYGEIRFTDSVRGSFGRRAYDTPYINRNDNRMSPNTFEAYTITGLIGGGDRPEWRFGAGYFDEIKERNADEFVSMSRDAGATVEEGVYAAGVNYKFGELSLGGINYYSDNIINIFYTEGRYAWQINDDTKFILAGQYTHQQATGDNLLTGSDFSTAQFGLKGEIAWGPALFTLAYTSTDDDDNMRNPWSGYPGYTSVQVEDFNRAGEDAFMLRAGYNFPSVPGLSVYGLWVSGNDPAFEGQFSRDEYDLNLQWTPPDGGLKGFSIRARYAYVEQDNGTELKDFRLILYYDPPLL